MMKRIILILFLSPFLVYAQAYQTIKPLEGPDSAEYHIYYKDINNVLNDFEGVYEYNGPGFYFKMELKKIFSNLDYFCEDMLVGKYQYIKDGVDLNYMDDSLIGLINHNNTKISLNWIHPAQQPLFCPECQYGKWLEGAAFDDINNKTAILYMAKRVVGGQQGVQVWLRLEATSHQPWESDNPIQLPIEDFFMAKIQ
jgi:hypothetical protein